MSIKKLFLFLLLLVTSAVYSQQNFQYFPEHPKAGEVITFTYTPAGDIANTQSPVEGIVYGLGEFEPGRNMQTAADLELKREGNKYTGSFKTDTAQNFIWFGFSDDGQLNFTIILLWFSLGSKTI